MAYYHETIDLPMPAPDLSPGDVIQLIVTSLQENNEADLGIQVTFNFASPKNKSATGPLDNFKQQVKDPLFQPMLSFAVYKTSDLVTDGERAQQIIVLLDENGLDAGYLFTLSKQNTPPFQDCWMTDSVMRVKPELYGITV